MSDAIGGTDAAYAASFAELYRREIVALTALATSLTGDRDVGQELAQEGLLRAYRDWAQVSMLDAPGAWVRRVVLNLVTDSLRRRRRERSVLSRLHPTETFQPAPTDPADEFWAAVRELPDLQRRVVALHYIDDVSVNDIARTLEVSVGTAKTSLHRARHSLARRLAAEVNDAYDR